MNKQTQTSSNPPKGQTSADTFFGSHEDLEAQLFVRLDRSGRERPPLTLKEMMQGEWNIGRPSPFLILVDRLRHTAFGELLKATEQENSPEGLKTLLQIFLIFTGVKAQEGMFPPSRGTRGRPISRRTALIYSMWVSLGRPSLYGNQLAKAVFQRAFTGANGIDRRRMRDQCRLAVQRQIKRLEKIQDSGRGGPNT